MSWSSVAETQIERLHFESPRTKAKDTWIHCKETSKVMIKGVLSIGKTICVVGRKEERKDDWDPRRVMTGKFPGPG